MRLSPMLSRPGPLPTLGNWSFEVKWDGFRAIVSTVDGLRVRSRRDWNMTALVPELEELPGGLVLDGELVAFNADGVPWFPSVCDRLLHGDNSVPLTLIVFDLVHEGCDSLLHLPYRVRRERLEALELRGPCWLTSERFDDGEALFATVCERGMEGVVAKPSGSAYRPGYRGWLKVKNPGYWRRADELGAFRRSVVWFSFARLAPLSLKGQRSTGVPSTAARTTTPQVVVLCPDCTSEEFGNG